MTASECQTFSTTLTDAIRLEAGRIKDTRILMDALGMLEQLGAFPPPAG
jgi:hypothetical protein